MRLLCLHHLRKQQFPSSFLTPLCLCVTYARVPRRIQTPEQQSVIAEHCALLARHPPEGASEPVSEGDADGVADEGLPDGVFEGDTEKGLASGVRLSVFSTPAV